MLYFEVGVFCAPRETFKYFEICFSFVTSRLRGQFCCTTLKLCFVGSSETLLKLQRLASSGGQRRISPSVIKTIQLTLRREIIDV
jgi:hypothetical protein